MSPAAVNSGTHGSCDLHSEALERFKNATYNNQLNRKKYLGNSQSIGGIFI